jgi:exodeoxyribonuclease V beta subunit
MTRPVPPRFLVEEAVFPPGVTCIEAGAGTGKTFNIALGVVKLLLEQEADGSPRFGGIGNLLVVTFTNAATDELITRIRRVLRVAATYYAGEPTPPADQALVDRLRLMARARIPFAQDRLREALASLDRLAVYTIHGFCKRVLDDYALETGVAPGTTLLDDEQPLIRDGLLDWWRHRGYDAPERAAWLLSKHLTPDSLVSSYQAWQQWPAAALAPDAPLEQVEAELRRTLHELGTAWDADGFRARLSAIRWNSKAALQDPEVVEALLASLAALWQGDLLQAPALKQLDVEVLRNQANKQGASNKAAAEAMAEWPEVRLARDAAAAVRQLDVAIRTDALAFTREWVTAEKGRRMALGFNDLLAMVGNVLDRDADGVLARALRQQYQAALIDEFQDTDRHQVTIFRRIFAGAPLVVIGDPKQAIYGFRGADLRSYLGVADTADQRFRLAENFRSSDAMVQAVNALFQRRRHPFFSTGIRFDPADAAKHQQIPPVLREDPALHWLRLAPDAQAPWWSTGEAEKVALTACTNEIVRLLEAGLAAGSMAVLVRTGAEGRAMQAMLRSAGVPAVVAGMDSIFRSHEVDELSLVLAAISTPHDTRRVRAALATELWGYAYDAVRALGEREAALEWDTLIGELTRLRQHWVRYGVATLWEAWSEYTGLAVRLLRYPDGERRLTNLRHAIDLLHEAASEHRLNPDGLLQWLAGERHQATAETVSTETAELRLETDADAVQIVTVHKSKGLEYDVVFLPTLWKARRPKVDAAPPPVLSLEADGDAFDLGSPRHAERLRAANARRLEEDLRLAYVALTRARFRTYVVWGAVKSGAGKSDHLTVSGSIHSALGYLLLDDPAINEAAIETLPDADRADEVARRLLATVVQWPATLDALVTVSAGRMTVRDIQTGMVTRRWRAEAGSLGIPVARVLPFEADSPQLGTHQIASYTGLTRVVTAHGGDAGPRPVPEASDREGPADSHATERERLAQLPAEDFRSFPAGAAAGTLLHTLFEELAPALPDELLRTEVRTRLAASAFGGATLEARTDAVCRMLRQVWCTPFDCGSHAVRLADVPAVAQRHEWEFLLPLADRERPLSADALARCFALAPMASERAYAAAVRGLDIRQVHGFLTGVIDLVFEANGRWYVVDWKSNRLPLDPASYAPDRLWEVMGDAHYVLQYHLYLVAVHRLLAERIPGYAYDTHIGGAAYAFLRGFGGPEVSCTGHGWFTARPSREVIEALDDLIGRAGRRTA